jgi:hypothetical protein
MLLNLLKFSLFSGPQARKFGKSMKYSNNSHTGRQAAATPSTLRSPPRPHLNPSNSRSNSRQSPPQGLPPSPPSSTPQLPKRPPGYNTTRDAHPIPIAGSRGGPMGRPPPPPSEAPPSRGAMMNRPLPIPTDDDDTPAPHAGRPGNMIRPPPPPSGPAPPNQPTVYQGIKLPALGITQHISLKVHQNIL